MNQNKSVSSYNILEANFDNRKGATHASKFMGSSDRNLVTDTNFFPKESQGTGDDVKKTPAGSKDRSQKD